MSVSNAAISGGLTRLKGQIVALAWKNFTFGRKASGLGPSIPEQQSRYVNTVLQSMAVFRFAAFAMGTGLVFGLGEPQVPSLTAKIIVSLSGGYNIVIILARFNLAIHYRIARWLILAVEVPLVVSLVLLTGALDSPYLLYSLSPILVTSLLTDALSATMAAVIIALSITGGHLAAGLELGGYPWILTGNYLAFALLYGAVCLLVTFLPFLSNLNWQRRVRSESMFSERQRLRREVHDNIAQTLAFLSLKAKRAEEKASDSRLALTAKDVSDISGAVEQAYLSVRDYLDGTEEEQAMQPLSARLNTAAKRWSRQTGLPVRLRLTNQDLGLEPKVEQQLFQIVREALANVGKHAMPSRVWLDLESTPDEVLLKVRDDGRGFSSSQPRGHGLEIMKERAAMVGASLDVTSAPGKGTRVHVVYPKDRRKAGR